MSFYILMHAYSQTGQCGGCWWHRDVCSKQAGDGLYYVYGDVIMGAMASQITTLPIVYLIVYSGADQRKHQSSASLAFIRGIHRWPVNSPHKGPVTRTRLPFDDVIMCDWLFSCWLWTDLNAAMIYLLFGNNFVYAPRQWETTLHCNVVSH